MNKQKRLSSRARQLHAEALVWDNHGCLPQDLARLPHFVGQLARYRNAGVDFISINIGDAQSPLDNYVKMAAFVRHWIAAHPDDTVLALRPGDIEQAKREGKLAIAFDIEGGFAVQHQISLLSLFYDLGVRWMLLAYNRNNTLGGRLP
jgi:membrane dipeptidase